MHTETDQRILLFYELISDWKNHQDVEETMMKQKISYASNWTVCIMVAIPILTIMGCGPNPASDFWKAVEALRNKDYTTAQQYADRVKAAQPDYVPAYLLLGRVGSLKGDQGSADLNYRTAYDLMSRRDFKLRTEDVQARDCDQKISWQEAAFYLADSEFRNMNYNRAERYYDTVIKDPGSEQWKQTALAYKEATHDFFGYRRSLESLRAQNIKTPNDPRIQADMAALFMDMASGLTRLGKMKSIGEQVALAAKFRDQAREALKTVYAASPEVDLRQTEALLDYTESQEYIMRGKTEEALQKAMDACTRNPNNGKYHFTVASILAAMGAKLNEPQFRMDERINYVRKAVELDPKTVVYQRAYAYLLMDTGRMQEARDQLIKAREVIGDNEVIDAVLADLERKMEQPSPTAAP